MARPRKWGSDAERQAAFKARRNVTAGFVTDPVTLLGTGNVTAGATSNVTESPIVNATIDNEFVSFRHQPHVPMSLFANAGRGSPRRHTDGRDYVLVSRHAGSDLGELGIVTLADWSARLTQRCEHGQAGWACHGC